jgi:hypothetical protein
MNRVVGAVCALALLACTFSAATAFGNTVNRPKRAYVAPRYDLAKEITLQGVIESVVAKPATGMMPGAHLLVAGTKLGTVDVQLGPWGLKGSRSGVLAAGSSVSIAGLMSTFNGRSVLLARLVQAGGRTITIRNEHGFTLLPGAAERNARGFNFGGAR